MVKVTHILTAIGVAALAGASPVGATYGSYQGGSSSGGPTPVPEPATMGLFGLATGGLAYARLRRRKAGKAKQAA